LEPEKWIENTIQHDVIFSLNKNGIQQINTWNATKNITDLLDVFFETLYRNQNIGSFLHTFAILSLHEEVQVLEYILHLFLKKNDTWLIPLIGLLENTIHITQLSDQIKEKCKVPWVYTILQFWSSLYGRNYCVNDSTDIDIELIINKNFNIVSIKNTVLYGYTHWDIEKDFLDFLRSRADYFSFKTYYDGRVIDFRITHKNCFDNICHNSLEYWDNYVMKEFRKQPRKHGIVAWKNFNGDIVSWENDIHSTLEWQIIYYPLFVYNQGRFVSWNNIDKYCSFTEGYINEVIVKKQLYELRKRFNFIFNNQKDKEKINNYANISDIFIRNHCFPHFLVHDLEYRYKLYQKLFNS